MRDAQAAAGSAGGATHSGGSSSSTGLAGLQQLQRAASSDAAAGTPGDLERRSSKRVWRKAQELVLELPAPRPSRPPAKSAPSKPAVAAAAAAARPPAKKAAAPAKGAAKQAAKGTVAAPQLALPAAHLPPPPLVMPAAPSAAAAAAVAAAAAAGDGSMPAACTGPAKQVMALVAQVHKQDAMDAWFGQQMGIGIGELPSAQQQGTDALSQMYWLHRSGGFHQGIYW